MKTGALSFVGARHAWGAGGESSPPDRQRAEAAAAAFVGTVRGAHGLRGGASESFPLTPSKRIAERRQSLPPDSPFGAEALRLAAVCSAANSRRENAGCAPEGRAGRSAAAALHTGFGQHLASTLNRPAKSWAFSLWPISKHGKRLTR